MLGDRLFGPLWGLAGQGNEILFKILARRGDHVARRVPGPCAAREWRGRSHWAWASKWKGLEADVLEKLCSTFVYAIGNSTEGLDRLPSIARMRESPLDPAHLEFGSSSDDEPELEFRREKGPESREQQRQWCWTNRFSIFGEIVASICSQTSERRGAWIIHGERASPVWKSILVPTQNVVIMHLFLTKSGRWWWFGETTVCLRRG